MQEVVPNTNATANVRAEEDPENKIKQNKNDNKYTTFKIYIYKIIIVIKLEQQDEKNNRSRDAWRNKLLMEAEKHGGISY